MKDHPQRASRSKDTATSAERSNTTSRSVPSAPRPRRTTWSALGVSRDRMTTISYGEELPLCHEHTESCSQRNRRDHFVVDRERLGGSRRMRLVRFALFTGTHSRCRWLAVRRGPISSGFVAISRKCGRLLADTQVAVDKVNRRLDTRAIDSRTEDRRAQCDRCTRPRAPRRRPRSASRRAERRPTSRQRRGTPVTTRAGGGRCRRDEAHPGGGDRMATRDGRSRRRNDPELSPRSAALSRRADSIRRSSSFATSCARTANPISRTTRSTGSARRTTAAATTTARSSSSTRCCSSTRRATRFRGRCWPWRRPSANRAIQIDARLILQKLISDHGE